MGKALAIYTGLRFLLFTGAFGIALVARLGGFAAILVGFVASALLAPLLLRGPRDRLTAELAERSARRQADRARLRESLDD